MINEGNHADRLREVVFLIAAEDGILPVLPTLKYRRFHRIAPERPERRPCRFPGADNVRRLDQILAAQSNADLIDTIQSVTNIFRQDINDSRGGTRTHQGRQPGPLELTIKSQRFFLDDLA
jgi:hypothetical protein